MPEEKRSSLSEINFSKFSKAFEREHPEMAQDPKRLLHHLRQLAAHVDDQVDILCKSAIEDLCQTFLLISRYLREKFGHLDFATLA